MHRSSYFAALGVACALTFAAGAQASIIAQVGGAVVTATATEDFQSGSGNLTNATTWVGASITALDFGAGSGWAYINGSFSFFGCTSQCLYQNGGTNGLVHVSLNTGADFDAIQIDLGNGFGPADPQFVWVQAYDNGLFTGFEFDLDIATPGTISVISQGTAFDEIRLGVYSVAGTRDQHDINSLSAASIDNIRIGSTASAPEPASLAMLALGLVGLAGVRRGGSRRG